MAGSVRMTPARIVLPASALVLAGMACRMGWIDANTVYGALAVPMILMVVIGAVLLFSFPVLLAGVLVWLLVRGLARLRQERHAGAVP